MMCLLTVVLVDQAYGVCDYTTTFYDATHTLYNWPHTGRPRPRLVTNFEQKNRCNICRELRPPEVYPRLDASAHLPLAVPFSRE